MPLSDHELRSWLDQVLAAANPLCDFIEGNLPLDDTFGWGARLDAMWTKRSLESSRPCGLLLTGPNGCGKHTAVTHMFRTLYDSHCALLLDGRELCADGYAAATRRLRYALDNPQNDLSWLLVLENMEDCSCRQELLTWLGQAVDAAWASSAGSPSLFVILIDSREDEIPSILRRHLRLCRMSLPTSRRRRAFFENGQFAMIPSLVTMDLLVNSTVGLTYAQLVDLARNLECTLYYQKFTDEDLLEFLEEQMPDLLPEDPLQSLAQSAQLFIESLPELMTHMGTAVVPATVIQTQSKSEDDKSDNPDNPLEELQMPDERDFKKEITEMSTQELSSDLFGKERLKQMRIKHNARQTA